MFHSLVQLINVLLVLFLLTSCQQGGPSGPLSTGRTPLQHSIRTTVIDRDVRNTLLFVNSVNKRLPGGQILIQANFENRLRSQDVWADISFEFMDEDNMLIDRTEWVPTLFPASQITMIQGSSISSHAAKHVLLMRNLKTANGKIVGPARKIFEYPSSYLP